MPINTREPLDPKISLWHFLAYRLRWERENRGLSLTQWGKIIGAARSTVSNIEAGRRKIDEGQAKTLDKKWNTGGLFELLLWYARTAHDPNWFRQYTQYEAEATVIRIYQGQVIPVPLQTEDYARAFLKAGGVQDIDRAIAARLARQEAILGRPHPPLLLVLLDEGVLDRPIGGPKTMKEQLQRLLDLAELPQVIVRVIPKSAGAHVGLDGSVQIMSLESRNIAYVGALRGGRLVEAPSEVRELGLDYERIGAKALSEDGSRTLIEKLMEI
jgi:transcriptional regulator with XRE-family HTH domain